MDSWRGTHAQSNGTIRRQAASLTGVSMLLNDHQRHFKRRFEGPRWTDTHQLYADRSDAPHVSNVVDNRRAYHQLGFGVTSLQSRGGGAIPCRS